jgi:hypothetical protein
VDWELSGVGDEHAVVEQRAAITKEAHETRIDRSDFAKDRPSQTM